MDLPPPSERVLLDPSFLLSRDAVDWLESDEAVVNEVVISGAFLSAVREGRTSDFSRFVALEDETEVRPRLERLASFFERSYTFSYRGVQLGPEETEVLSVLLARGEPESEILADEWAFLFSNSWMAAKMRYAQDKFRDAGAVIVEYGRRLRGEMISAVVPEKHVPEVIKRSFALKVGAKWIVVAGAAAGGFYLLPVAIAGAAAVPVVRAFDA
jgi:hypothetical protein